MGFKMFAQRNFLVLVPVILFLIAASSPFSAAAQNNQTSPQAIRRAVELEALQNARKAFDAGDYQKAQTGFEMLGDLAKNPDIRRSALFGLASTRLILADSKDSFDRAVAAWRKWAAEAAPCKGMQDPRMLTPFLLRLQSAIKDGGGPLGAKEKHDDSRCIVLMKERVVQALRAKLELAQRQIRRLRHDLKSLDEIHRKYEEKKQEMTP